jgi:diguanylate cyclase (GGDEF)-like protein
MPAIRTAETADAAWETLSRAPVALLALGVDLSVADVEALCRRFRALDRSRFTVILAVRPEAETETGRLLAAGVDDLVGDRCGGPGAEIRLAVAEHRVRERMERSVAEDSRRVFDARLRRHAFRDGLTDVLRRPWFLDRFIREVRVARRHGRKAALLLLDFDDLVRVNAEHGLAAGDVLLKSAVGALRNGMRDCDDWGRMNGDTFAVALPETGLAGARAAAERIRRFLSERSWETGTGATVFLTVSMGAAGFSGRNDTAERMFLRAEALLAQAQAAGGDQIRTDPVHEKGDAITGPTRPESQHL